MADISTRKRRDGSCGYTALIRITKNGQRLHQEAKTFSSQTAAKEWAKRREVEPEDPTALIRASAPARTLKELIRWYIDTFHAVGWGRTKSAVLKFLENHEIGTADALRLTTPILVDHISPGAARIRTARSPTRGSCFWTSRCRRSTASRYYGASRRMRARARSPSSCSHPAPRKAIS